MPRLPKRLNNRDKFSTYIIAIDTQNGRKAIQWESQPRLERYLELCAKNNPEFAGLLYEQDGGNDVAVFLVDIAVNNPQPLADWEPVHRKFLALQCLGAYLEEQCYWAAREIWQNHQERSWEDYLDIAKFFIYDEDKILDILAKYNQQNAELKTYVQRILLRIIRNEAQVGKFSDGRLLCQNSPKYLREALSTAGYQEPEISYYIFVRQSFKEVYMLKVKNPNRPQGGKWPQPDAEDFVETAKACNTDKEAAIHEVKVGLPRLDGTRVEQWLRNCIKALRDYPKWIEPRESIEVLEREHGYTVEDLFAHSRIEKLSSTEGKGRRQQVDGVFREEMKAIKANIENRIQKNQLKLFYRLLPLLYYGVGLTYTQLEQIFGVKQSNLTRNLLKYYENPLMKCLAGLKKSDEWVKPYVLEWLKKHYGSPLHSDLIQAALVEAIAKLESQHQEVLRLRYGEKMNSQQIARRQGIIYSEVDQRIDEAQQGLEKALLKAIGRWRKAIVKSWLEKLYHQEIELAVQSAFSDGSKPTAEMLQDFLLRWIRSTANISLDKEEELAKIDKLVLKLLPKGSE